MSASSADDLRLRETLAQARETLEARREADEERHQRDAAADAVTVEEFLTEAAAAIEAEDATEWSRFEGIGPDVLAGYVARLRRLTAEVSESGVTDRVMDEVRDLAEGGIHRARAQLAQTRDVDEERRERAAIARLNRVRDALGDFERVPLEPRRDAAGIDDREQCLDLAASAAVERERGMER